MKMLLNNRADTDTQIVDYNGALDATPAQIKKRDALLQDKIIALSW
jgi:hypothetical protein